jgi:hypothetical protein
VNDFRRQVAKCRGYFSRSVAILAAPDDRSVRETSDAMSLTGPGLFVAPIGAVLGGERGMYIAASAGDVAVGGLGIWKSLSENGMSFVRGTHPDKILFAKDVGSLYQAATAPDFDRNYYQPDVNAFEPNQGYDLDALDPPGMGDVEGPQDPQDTEWA